MAHKVTLEKKFDEAIAHELPQLAKLIAEETSVPGDPLKNPKMQAEKIEKELHHDLKVYKKRCKEGMELCLAAAIELAAHDTSINIKDVAADFLKASKLFDSIEAAKKLGEQALEGKTWKELLHLRDSSLEALYKGARSIFDAGKYEKAEEAFFVLSLLDTKQYSFWIGLGHSAYHAKQHAKHHEIAIKAYMAASMIKPSSIWPHIYAANCFEAEKDYKHALMALEEAQEINNNSSHKDVKIGHELTRRINVLSHKA